MATLRIAIGLIRARHHGPNIAAATRTLGRRTEKLLGLLDHETVTPVTGAYAELALRMIRSNSVRADLAQ